MDAKTAIKYLRKHANTLVEHSKGNEKYAERYTNIADFIEQQEKEIVELTNDNGQQHIEIMLLSRKKEQQEKYVELGRAAEKARKNQCPFMGKYDFMSKTCKRCIIRDYCQKRAELQRVEGE